MKYWWAIPIILIQRFINRLMNFMNGRLLGEELIAVYREADTAGVQNWKRKAYRSYL